MPYISRGAQLARVTDKSQRIIVESKTEMFLLRRYVMSRQYYKNTSRKWALLLTQHPETYSAPDVT